MTYLVLTWHVFVNQEVKSYELGVKQTKNPNLMIYIGNDGKMTYFSVYLLVQKPLYLWSNEVAWLNFFFTER